MGAPLTPQPRVSTCAGARRPIIHRGQTLLLLSNREIATWDRSAALPVQGLLCISSCQRSAPKTSLWHPATLCIPAKGLHKAFRPWASTLLGQPALGSGHQEKQLPWPQGSLAAQPQRDRCPRELPSAQGGLCLITMHFWGSPHPTASPPAAPGGQSLGRQEHHVLLKAVGHGAFSHEQPRCAA